MLFPQRATEPEHFDDPARTPAEIADAYRQLSRVNRLFRLDDPYTRILSQWLGSAHCARLSILDVGAGDGWLGGQMEQWARQFGWRWQVTNLDLNTVPLQLNPQTHRVGGSVLRLPFHDQSFDLVIASQMTHHLNTDEEVVQHFREAWRVGALGVFISDMKRSGFLYLVLWGMLRVLGLSPEMRSDGLLSVKRGWRAEELTTLAARAGLSGASVQSYYGTRLIVAAKKPSASADATGTTATCRAADESCSIPHGR